MKILKINIGGKNIGKSNGTINIKYSNSSDTLCNSENDDTNTNFNST